MQTAKRRQDSLWKPRYRKYVRALLRGDIIDFIVEAKRYDTRLKIHSALSDSLKSEDVVEKLLEPPLLLEPFIVRVKIKNDALYDDVDRLVEKYSSYSQFAPW